MDDALSASEIAVVDLEQSSRRASLAVTAAAVSTLALTAAAIVTPLFFVLAAMCYYALAVLVHHQLHYTAAATRIGGETVLPDTPCLKSVEQSPPPSGTCPRCGFVVDNAFACVMCAHPERIFSAEGSCEAK
jgi:hypothetical protein